MEWGILPYALGFGFVMIITYFAWSLWNKNKINHCVALVYEVIGNEEVFIGLHGMVRVENRKITCLKIKGFDHSYMDLPEPKDYFQSRNSGKVLHVTKYGERDFRIKKRFDGSWYREIEQDVYEEVIDENQNVIPNLVKNDDGTAKTETVREVYDNPLGVDQKGMDAIRVSLINEEEIKKELAEDTFWDKYGASIIMVSVFLIATLLVMKVSSDTKNSFVMESQNCVDAANEVKKAAKDINEPSWVEKIVGSVRNEEPPPPN